MSKGHFCFPLFLLLFSIVFVPQLLQAEDLVGLKNLSWEEQKDKTRIILETTKPLAYHVVASQTAAEVHVELGNLDLRNLPQELFINTNEVISLQTYPQSNGQKAKIVVKLNSYRPHHVTTEGNKLLIDVGGIAGGDLLAQTQPLPTIDEQQTLPEAEVVEPAEEVDSSQRAEVKPPAPVRTESVGEPIPIQTPVQAATEISDVRIDSLSMETVEVVLVANGSLQYDVFELSNPERLVIDMKSVTMAPGMKNTIAGSQDLFERVRVAQFQVAPNVVRAVIDMNKKVPYSVIPEGSKLRIHLGEKLDESPANANGGAEVLEPMIQTDSASAEPVMQAQLDVSEAATESQQVPEEVAPSPMNNEQFFSFEPDTTLFAQAGSSTSSGSSPSESYQERTLRGSSKQYTGEPFSFDFKDIDIKDLFRFIADISGLNVILDPSVRGSVTLKLTEVPWDQALDLITKNQGLGYTIEGNVIRIAPLSKIAQEERARADAEKQQMLSAPLVTKIKPLSYAKAQEVDRVIKRLLTAKGSSIVDNRTNTMIITEIDTNIDQIMNLVDTLDSQTPQVVIEARIVETTKNYSQAFGIQWGFRGIVDPAFGNNTSLQFPSNMLFDGSNITPQQGGIGGNPLGGYAVNLPTNTAPSSAVLISMGNILDTFRLDLALMALENTGHGRILSSPKVATQNNTRAEILQGTQVPVQTVANNTITTQYVAAALRMSVTPQITAEGTIIMDVEVENNRPDFANVVFGTPPIITERARTTLLVEDGGTTVIGGIFTSSDSYAQGRTPGLHRIPLLGWLFKNNNITRENRELLIFLTPRIMR